MIEYLVIAWIAVGVFQEVVVPVGTEAINQATEATQGLVTKAETILN